MKDIKTLINKKSAKEFIQGNFIFSFVSLGVSLVIIALYVIFGVINKSWLDTLQIVLIVLGGILLVLSIIMIVNYVASINKMDNLVRTIVYHFSDVEITFDIYREEKLVQSGKALYNDLLEYKETKNYIYIRQRNNTWLILNKEDELISFLNNKGIFKHKSFLGR